MVNLVAFTSKYFGFSAYIQTYRNSILKNYSFLFFFSDYNLEFETKGRTLIEGI